MHPALPSSAFFPSVPFFRILCHFFLRRTTNKALTVGGETLKEGDWLPLNGTTGEGIVPALDPLDQRPHAVARASHCYQCCYVGIPLGEVVLPTSGP